jgi:predicted metal-binding membrane protein
MFAPAHLRVAHRDRAILAGSLVAIAATAWLALWLWEGSPYGHYLHHDGVGAVGGGGAGALGNSLVIGAIAFTVGWTLMIVAMMLPSSVPLVVTFGALVGRRRQPARLVALLLVGYLLVWAGFGLAAWAADRGVHAAVEALPWLAEHPELIIGATLLTAGLWQFSPLRDRCLDECRSPLGFVLNRWRGTSERREALLMGIAHGAFCVGCCWSLMLVMFGVGISSLTAMLVLGGLTAIEKNLPQGRRLSRPLGVVLVLAAVYAVAA